MIGTPLRVNIPPGIVLPKIPATPGAAGLKKQVKPVLLFLLLLLIWFICPILIHQTDPQADVAPQSMWMLVILSLLVFLLVLALCWWLLQHFWRQLRLPDLHSILSQFKTLSSWQQIIFFWLSFVSLLLAALGCLLSIC